MKLDVPGSLQSNYFCTKYTYICSTIARKSKQSSTVAVMSEARVSSCYRYFSIIFGNALISLHQKSDGYKYTIFVYKIYYSLCCVQIQLFRRRLLAHSSFSYHILLVYRFLYQKEKLHLY